MNSLRGGEEPALQEEEISDLQKTLFKKWPLLEETGVSAGKN
jgi:hypothetical protein